MKRLQEKKQATTLPTSATAIKKNRTTGYELHLLCQTLDLIQCFFWLSPRSGRKGAIFSAFYCVCPSDGQPACSLWPPATHSSTGAIRPSPPSQMVASDHPKRLKWSLATTPIQKSVRSEPKTFTLLGGGRGPEPRGAPFWGLILCLRKYNGAIPIRRMVPR